LRLLCAATKKEAFVARSVSGHNIELLAQSIDGDRLRGQRDEFSRLGCEAISHCRIKISD